MVEQTSDWNLEPYSGVGPLRLGMTQSEVGAVLGAPVSQSVDDGEIEARYLDRNVLCIFNEGRLAEIGLTPSKVVNPVIGDLQPFHDEAEQFLRALDKLHAPIVEGFGMLFVDDLGITLTGIHDGDRPQTAMTVFTRERLEMYGFEGTPVSFA